MEVQGVKVRVKKEYYDREKKQNMKENAEFEVNDTRGGVLVSAGVAEDITEAGKRQQEETQEDTDATQEDAEIAEEKPKNKGKKKATKNE